MSPDHGIMKNKQYWSYFGERQCSFFKMKKSRKYKYCWTLNSEYFISSVLYLSQQVKAVLISIWDHRRKLLSVDINIGYENEGWENPPEVAFFFSKFVQFFCCQKNCRRGDQKA